MLLVLDLESTKTNKLIAQGGRCAAECGPDALGREAHDIRGGDSGHEVCIGTAMLQHTLCFDCCGGLFVAVVGVAVGDGGGAVYFKALDVQFFVLMVTR